ncbi:MAG TPA: type II toxin-antitoxin system HicA family toxin [Gaiellaceae bacterium]
MKTIVTVFRTSNSPATRDAPHAEQKRASSGFSVPQRAPRRLLARLARVDLANVSFSDMRRLVESFAFELRRTTGSNHIFVHPDVPELLNLQGVRGQAKPYQAGSSSGRSSDTL